MPAASERERREVRGVPIARDDLRAHRLRREAERAERARLDRRREVRVRPDRAGDLADGDLRARRGEARLAARDLGVVPGERETEGDRLGEDAVAAADHRRLRVLARAPRERGEQRVAAREEQIGRVAEQDGERGVEHVARRHPAVEPARVDARRAPRRA